MAKYSQVDPGLIQAVASAIEACGIEGSPVAGSSPDSWQEMARVAIRRVRSFDRRHKAAADEENQIRDIAEGFIAVFEDDPKLVGPLIEDYKYVARAALAAINGYEASQGSGDKR